MQSLAFAVLLPADRAEVIVDALTSCWRGVRRESFRDARRRAGIVREGVWIQSGPAGDLAIVYLEADDLAAALTFLRTSAEPFDAWFRHHAAPVHGVVWEESFTTPTLVLDFDVAGTD